MLERVLFDSWALALGLVVGSYLNVVAHRLPRGQSTVRPRSACPSCGAAIRARDNVPILSFLVLRGRCRSCGAPIGWRYPAVEALTGLLFLACAERFGLSTEALFAAVLCGLLVVLAAIDVDHFLLPDRLTFPGLAIGSVLGPLLTHRGLLDALLGAVVGAGVLILLINIWYWLRNEEGMGLGDVNMLAMIGAFLGWQGVLETLFFSAASGAVTGLALVAGGRLGMKSRLPFGLFLALGGLVALFFGEPLLDLYLELL